MRGKTIFAVAAALLLLSGALILLPTHRVAAPSPALGVSPAAASAYQSERSNVISEWTSLQARLHSDFSLPPIPAWLPPAIALIEGVACGVAAGLTAGAAIMPCFFLVGMTDVAILAYAILASLFPPVIPLSPLYNPALISQNQILGAANVSYKLAYQSAYDFMEAQLVLYSTEAYQAMHAALIQLPNATFNPNLALAQGNVLDPLLSTFDGYAVNLQNITDSAFRAESNLYGSSGGYGADGVVCQLHINDHSHGANFTVHSPVDYGPNGSVTRVLPNGGAAQGPINYGQECYNNLNSSSGHVFAGASVTDSAANGSVVGFELRNNVPIYVSGPNATLSTPFDNVSIEFKSLLSPKDFNLTLTATHTLKANLTRGLYVPLFSATPTIIGMGFMPLLNFSQPLSTTMPILNASTLDGAQMNAYAPSGHRISSLTFDCSQALSSTLASIYDIYSSGGMETNASAVSVCGNMPLLLGFAGTIMAGIGNIAKGYWSFLHALGIYSTDTLPPNCDALTPSLPLGVSVPLTEWLNLDPNAVLGFFTAYAISQAENYGANVTSNYCGGLLRPPVTISLTAINRFLVADIYTHQSPQNFSRRSTWLAQTQIVWPAAKLAPISLKVNATWEAPAANPVQLWTGPLAETSKTSMPNLVTTNYTVLNASNAGEYSFLSRLVLWPFLGNSTLTAGSEYPNSTDGRVVGAGDALFPEECWVEGASGWASQRSCSFNLTVLNYSANGTSNICLLLGSCSSTGGGGFPLPTVECGNLIVDTFAAPFRSLPIIGAFACEIGWIILIVIALLGVYVAVVVARALTKKKE